MNQKKIRRPLRQLIGNKKGFISVEKCLASGKKWLNRKNFILDMPLKSRSESELKNMMTVANLMTDAALLRKGSVGAHYRSDYREKGEGWRKHTASEKGKEAGWIEYENGTKAQRHKGTE